VRQVSFFDVFPEAALKPLRVVGRSALSAYWLRLLLGLRFDCQRDWHPLALLKHRPGEHRSPRERASWARQTGRLADHALGIGELR
jgi:hypothetical protein